MTEDPNGSGVAMMLVGGLMVAFSVVTIPLTSNPVPSTTAIIGLFSMGVGARKRHT